MKDENKRAEVLLELHKQKLDHFKQTRDIEFKVNIAIWTLVVLIGYVVKVSMWFYIPVAIVIAGVHFFWMILIQNSQNMDHYYMNLYRANIEQIAGLTLDEYESHPFLRPFQATAGKIGLRGLHWVTIELTMTLALLAFVGIFIYQKNHSIVDKHHETCEYEQDISKTY